MHTLKTLFIVSFIVALICMALAPSHEDSPLHTIGQVALGIAFVLTGLWIAY